MSTAQVRQLRQIHPIRIAALEAARKLEALQPTRVVGEPDQDDVANMIDDGEVLATIFDAVLKAWSDYAGSHLGMSRKDLEPFQSIVSSAMDGDALYHVIQRAYDERLEDYIHAGDDEG